MAGHLTDIRMFGQVLRCMWTSAECVDIGMDFRMSSKCLDIWTAVLASAECLDTIPDIC